LIVIIIIGLLAGILFAVFAPARNKSKESVCQSNLRQMYLATSMYRNDYDGQDPEVGVKLTCSDLGVPCTSESYTALLRSHVKDWKVLICPADPRSNPPTATTLQCDYLPAGIPMTWDDSEMAKNSVQEKQKILASLGGRTPLYICEKRFHDSPVALADAPRDATKKIVIIRYDGSAQLKIVPLLSMSPYEKY
jgi:type II secretory pathway pseudopilin PulG